MKLRTSFFNPTVLRKDITRFAPVWGLYTLFTLLFVLLLWEADNSAARFVTNSPELFLAMGMVNFLYAPLVGILLFGDLFKSRLCNALHALPMRREGWFLTHLSAGLLFCIVPNGAAALLTAALLQEYAWVAFLWLALMVLQYLFFFGVTVFATQCAGNHLGAIAAYGIVNFLAVIAGWLVIIFYEPLLYGIELDFSAMAQYSPIVRFCNANYVLFQYDNMHEAADFLGFVGADWGYLGIAAGVGAVLLGVSVVIYRVRQLESAGDLIAFKPAAPVFLVIYTLCAGAILYFIADMAAPVLIYIFLAIGFAIGFFTGRMLLERKVRVFDRKNLISFGILGTVFAVTVGITALDPMGITRYVPETDNVSSVRVCFSHYYYDINHDTVTLTDPDAIETVTGIHQGCLDTPCEERYDRIPLYLSYTMTNGTTVNRYYYLSESDPAVNALAVYFSAVEAVFGSTTPEYILHNLRLMEAYSHREDLPLTAIATKDSYLDTEYYTEKYGDKGNPYFYLTSTPEADPILTGLFEAIKADCAAGNMAQNGLVQDTDIYAQINIQYLSVDVEYLDITIYYGCENTVAFLESLSTKPMVGTAK